MRIHLAGHSAGAIFLATLADRIVQTGLRIESLALLAGAVTNADFVRWVVPTSRSPTTATAHRSSPSRRSSAYRLRPDRADGAGRQVPGRRRDRLPQVLLYLVARALEPNPDARTGMVPLVGLQPGLGSVPAGWSQTLGQVLVADGAKIVFAPGGAPPDPRSDARGHGDFDDDRATMTSVLLRMLDVTDPPAGSYVPNDTIRDLQARRRRERSLPVPTSAPAPVGARVATTRRRAERPSLREAGDPPCDQPPRRLHGPAGPR